jgi:flagellar hook-associated protein 3
MTISTSLFFSRAVDLMSRNQSELASMQEKVATGKELVRPSDGVDTALNIARMKTSIEELEGYQSSLNFVSDRLQIEESFLQGTSDVLTEIKTLVIQGANGSYNTSDREVIALQVNELVSEIQNLANGTDANGNYVFSGTRVKTKPYQHDEAGTIRYVGDRVENNLNFTKTRVSQVGRSGPDIFQSVFSGENLNVVPGIYDLSIGSEIEAGDEFNLTIDGHEFTYTAITGDNRSRVAEYFNDEIQALIDDEILDQVTVSASSGNIQITSTDGAERSITVSADNVRSGIDTQSFDAVISQSPDPGRPEKIEFFEALQSVVTVLETGSQQDIQDRLDYLDQMIDKATYGLADIGVERRTIESELALNDELQAIMKTNLSGEEDLDYAEAITKLQAKMLSLEAAQSSFAKISNLSVFDYLR